MENQLTNQPILIVGAPRSGTTLLSALLSSHSRIACGPETHFFSKLDPLALKAAVQDRAWPAKGVTLLKSLKLSGAPVHQLFNLEINEIANYLQRQQPSVSALLEALTKLHAQKQGKPRWAEKTPNHQLHLPAIRTAFPNATILRIVRDPRDSALSMRKLPWASQSVLANCYLWTHWYYSSRSFFNTDSNTLTIRYEDLLAQPNETLQLICDRISEPFEQSMLNTSQAATSVAPSNEPWKQQVSQPIDASRAYVWRRKLPQELWNAASHICQAGIEEFGYELTSKPSKTVMMYHLSRPFIESNQSLITNAANKGIHLKAVRIEALKTGKRYPDVIFCDLPDCGETKAQRLLNTCLFATMLIQRRRARNNNYYLPACVDTAQVPEVDKKLCAFFLRLLGEPKSSGRTGELFTATAWNPPKQAKETASQMK